MARSYIKRDTTYWQARKQGIQPAAAPIVVQAAPVAVERKPVPFPNVEYGNTFVSEAAGGTVAPSTGNTRSRQVNDGTIDGGAFQNLASMRLPWNIANGYVGVKDAIELCCKAYTGVPIFRNAIEVAVEFSNTSLHLKTDNKTVKRFFEEWFYAIQINKLKEEWFREYYRSGNVFLYKFSGKFGPKQFVGLQQIFGSAPKENTLPIRYSLLNPVNIFVQSGLTFPYTYVRLLSTFEIERLKHPLTPQDKQVFDQLPKYVKDQIKQANNFPLGLYIPVEPERLRFAFYKKQSYEPLATPMGYPVLPYIEWKLTLQKMDKSLAREIEQAILLVTTGEGPNEWNGGNGINQNNIARLQNLLNNQTISRALVADYTTKAQWLIPPIEKILGPEKYQIVNEDIKEGLQSILLDAGKDAKFATAQIKAKIFIQRLEEGQRVFLHDFLLPEIRFICENMGFRNLPEVEFEKINLQDETTMARVYTQMSQLGLLTPNELVNALETGVLPSPDEMAEDQTAYKAARDKGLYQPLAPAQQGEAGRPAGTSGIKQSTKRVSPQGTKAAFSISAYMRGLQTGDQLKAAIEAELRKQFKLKASAALGDKQIQAIDKLARAIMATTSQDKWMASAAAAVAKPPALSAETLEEIDTFAKAYEVDSWDAIVLRDCVTNPPAAAD